MKDFMAHNFNIDKILVACFVPQGKETPIHKNRPSQGLAFHLSGEECYIFSGTKILARPGDIVYLPKGSSYEVKSVSAGDCYAINFDLSEPIFFSPFCFKTKNTARFFEAFKVAENAWRAKFSGFEMRCKAQLYSIICDMLHEYELAYLPKDTSALIKPAIEHIHLFYTGENISVTHLASLCGISETYFRRLFSKVIGVSPLKYINKLKLSRAMDLISTGMYSMREVAEMSGFHDEAYFSREFKKAVGLSPSEYK